MSVLPDVGSVGDVRAQTALMSPCRHAGFPVLVQLAGAAIPALSPGKAWDYSQTHKIAAFFMIRDDKGFIILSGRAFGQLFATA
jgi:hypothetical protein